MKKTVYAFVLSLSFLSCGSNDKTDIQSADEVLNSNKINGSKIYHNPVSADKPLNSDEAARMTFDEVAHDFGTVKEGETVEHVFKFKNTGKAPLIITNASGSCGCTVPSWPKEPVAPGASSEIKVVFNSKGKSGTEEKEVTVLANTIPNKTVLRIAAFVKANP